MARSLAVWRKSWIDGFPRRTRRLVAAAMIVGLPLSYGLRATFIGSPTSGVIWKSIPFALTLLSLVAAVALMSFLRDRWTMSRKLDERQRQLRDRAAVISYGILAVFIVGASLVLAFPVLMLDRPVTLDRNVAQLLLSFAFPVATLPLAALAWIEPDPPAED